MWEAFIIALKWVHLKFWRPLKRARLSKYSYEKYSACTELDFQKYKCSITSSYEWAIYFEDYFVEIKNVRDLHGHLPKTMYCKLEKKHTKLLYWLFFFCCWFLLFPSFFFFGRYKLVFATIVFLMLSKVTEWKCIVRKRFTWF